MEVLGVLYLVTIIGLVTAYAVATLKQIADMAYDEYDEEE